MILSIKYLIFSIAALTIITFSAPAMAHKSPADCTGSGLHISLFANVIEAHAGDSILYSVDIFNGPAGGPVICDVSNIQANIVTPDGITHPITLTRTALSNGDIDHYPNVVTYVARSEDAKDDHSLAATASNTGDVHQNDTNSQGGANQGVNTILLTSPAPATLIVIKHVVNTNNGTSTAALFSLHIKSSGVDIAGSPSAGAEAPGTSYTLPSDTTYIVSENPNVSYLLTYSGDCDSSGNVTLIASATKTCILTNHDIPVVISSPTPQATPTPTPEPSDPVTPKKHTSSCINCRGSVYLTPEPVVIPIVTPPVIVTTINMPFPSAGIGPDEKNSFSLMTTAMAAIIFIIILSGTYMYVSNKK